MDISKLKTAKISSGTSAQIIADHFPKHQPFAKQDFSNSKEASVHKGMLPTEMLKMMDFYSVLTMLFI